MRRPLNDGDCSRSRRNRAAGAFDRAHHRCLENGRTHHRSFSSERPAGYPHTRWKGFSLYPFPAPLPRKDAQGGIDAIEVLQSTMRTRDYVEKGEGERKTILDVMHDGDTEEMLHLDGEIGWVIRPIAICGSRLRILLRIRKVQAVPLRSKSSGSTLWETEAQKKNLHPPALAIYLVSALS